MEAHFPELRLPTPPLILLSQPPFPFFSLPVAGCLMPLPHCLLSHAPPPLLIPELITPAILPASRDRLCSDPSFCSPWLRKNSGHPDSTTTMSLLGEGGPYLPHHPSYTHLDD